MMDDLDRQIAKDLIAAEIASRVAKRTHDGMPYVRFHGMIAEVVTDVFAELAVELQEQFERKLAELETRARAPADKTS